METRKKRYDTPERGEGITFRPHIRAEKAWKLFLQRRHETRYANQKKADILSDMVIELYEKEFGPLE